jgi:hypothetical protein
MVRSINGAWDRLWIAVFVGTLVGCGHWLTRCVLSPAGAVVRVPPGAAIVGDFGRMWSLADVLCPKSRGGRGSCPAGRGVRGDFGRMWSLADVLCPKSRGGGARVPPATWPSADPELAASARQVTLSVCSSSFS